jgi:ubiquinone/menaquinone biosynthesis C-methylase UbiE
MEQAGVTAAVPTLVKQQPITDLRFQPDGSVDAVVSLGALSRLQQQQQQQCLREIGRVLKPGMPLIFVEPLAEGGSPVRGIVGVSAGAGIPAAQLESWQRDPAFSFLQIDTALAGQDPHAVGVAVRSERAVSSQQGEDEEPSARQRRRKQPKASKGFS